MKKKYDAIKFTNLFTERVVNNLYIGGAIAIMLGVIIDGIYADLYYNTKEKDNKSTTRLANAFRKYNGSDNPYYDDAYISTPE